MRFKVLLLVLGLQCVWLLCTAFVQERVLATGKVILLETRPVDPRDLLRGDYLMLSYKVSDVPTRLFSPPVKSDLASAYGTKVFVALTPGTNGFWAVTRASTNDFAGSANEVVLRGRIDPPRWGGTNSVHVAYPPAIAAQVAGPSFPRA
ncbi:exported hypothetical protein [Verrucomicrobia bacterium]|nr:exported hypothetical protein [Verrucomicrobiota bacterium]